MTCPLCGQAKSATCCEQEKARHDAYRARQREIEDLLNLFDITIERNPSREVAGEWPSSPISRASSPFSPSFPARSFRLNGPEAVDRL